MLTAGLLLLGSKPVFGQNSFPDKWVGEYSGNMILANEGFPNDTIPVDFSLQELADDSIWTYTMHYHSKRFGEVTKDYRYLRVRKGDNTNFIFDEQNGIVMEMTLMNDCFYGMYDVMEMIFTNSLRRLDDNHLYFELFAAPTKNPRKSTSEEDGEIIEAKSFKPTLVQSVVLTRKP